MATDKAQSEAKSETLRKASINARHKAKVVLETLDLTVDEIINLKIDRAKLDPPQPVFADRAVALTASNTPIIGGKQTVQAAGTLQIGY